MLRGGEVECFAGEPGDNLLGLELVDRAGRLADRRLQDDLGLTEVG